MKEMRNLDQLFKDKLEDFDSIPPEEVWDNIKIKLEEKKKRRVISFWWKLSGIAASLLLGFWLTNALFLPTTNNSVVNQEKNNTIEKTVEEGNLFGNKNNKTLVNAESSNTNRKDTGIPKIPQKQLKKASESNTLLGNHSQINNSETLLVNQKKHTGKIPLFHQADMNNTVVENKTVIVDVEKNNSQNEPKTELYDNNKQHNNSLLEDNKKTESTKILVVKELNILEDLLKENEVQSGKVVQKAKKQKLDNRWQINPNIAPVYYSSLSNGSPLDSKYESNKKEYNTSVGYGLGVNYAVNKKLKLRFGINSISVNFTTNNVAVQLLSMASSSAPTPNNPTPNNPNSNDPNLSATYLIISLQGETNLINTQNDLGSNYASSANGNISQKMGYIELPLELSYKILDKKFGIEIIGGMSTLFLNQNTLSFQYSEKEINIGKANNLEEIHYSTNLGLGLKYSFLKQLEFKVEPVVKYQLNSFSTNSGSFKPYVFGLYTGIGYTF